MLKLGCGEEETPTNIHVTAGILFLFTTFYDDLPVG